MKLSAIALMLCAYAHAGAADVAHIKSIKTKILGHPAGKHHKRGIFSAVPPFKLGHDIPYVTHSVVKPLVVTYPPTASVAAVKIPVTGPHAPRYPVQVGHKVPGLPHPHHGLKFPHNNILAKTDHHFHHHHHHVAPRPIVPIAPAPIPATPVSHPAPVVPAATPTVAIGNAALASVPSLLPVSIFPSQALPLSAPPLSLIPSNSHIKSLLPTAAVPIPAAPVVSAPIIPLSQSVPYVIRPGGAVQTSVFATYPRYPFVNGFPAPYLPLAPAAPAVNTIPQLLLERPHLHPYHLLSQTTDSRRVIEQHRPNVIVEEDPNFHTTPVVPGHLHRTQESQSQPDFHLHPTQIVPQAAIPLQPAQPAIPLEHDGWSPVAAQAHDLGASYEAQTPQQTYHFTQDPATQVFEHHTENQLHDYQHQLQHHIQQQLEQAQYEQSLNNQQQHQQQQQQPTSQYGVPQQLGQEYDQTNDYSQQGHEFIQKNQNLPDHGQDFLHDQSYIQNSQTFNQHDQDFSQHGQDFSQHGQEFSQNGQDFNQNNYNALQLSQEYGAPHQSVEGRSADDADQQYHNHIPLGLQPPIDRPLDHFH